MTLSTERLILRKLGTTDAKRIKELAGDYDVAKTTLNIPHPYPEGSAVVFIHSVLESENKGQLATYAITKKESDDLIGMVSIKVNSTFNRGELGYWVGKPYWGQGYGTEAAKALVHFGFEKLKLNRIYAQAFTTNPGSWRIMEKIGLTYEGTLRQHVSRFGEYYDLAQYGLLKEEYTASP
ncbi:GNAT family N-acetyltransferase [Robertmurraya korlensis]|uniref:GNAT family N-acetyltransferase n=1 Tax=Robertmurraya korlensis TaxID=519977 RepID=UPI00082631F1|nr:GNAT family protein [Robertmurraya korlensis]